MTAVDSHSPPLTCLFSIELESLEDVPEYDQHKHYSVKFKTEQANGTTTVQTVVPHLDISDDTRDDYQFINNHLQLSQMDEVSSRSSRRMFRNSVSNFTMMSKDSSQTSYKVDFHQKIEFVQQMNWNMKLFEDIHASPLLPVKFQMELREHIGNSVISIGEIMTNLVEFTTCYSEGALKELDKQNGTHAAFPQQSIQSFIQSTASLKRTVLFPVYLSNERWAKLRVTVKSIWLSQPNSKRDNEAQQAQQQQPYFVVDEESQVVLPEYIKNSNQAQFTPNLLARTFMEKPQSGRFKQNSRMAVTEEDEDDIVKEIRETVQKTDEQKLVDTVSRMKRHLNEQIDHLQHSMTSVETKLDQLFEILEVLEAEKIGQCKQEGLQQLVPLLNEHQSTDVFKAIVFCDLHSSSQLYELGFANNQEDMILCLDMYYSVLRDCMRQSMGVELTNFAVQSKYTKRMSLNDKTQDLVASMDSSSPKEMDESVPMVKTPSISDSVICAFETTKQAIRFTLQVHLKLIEANWPESLLKLDGMLEAHPNSGNSKKSSSSLAKQYLYRGLRCRMAVDSRTKDKSLLSTVKRATFLSRYAHGGQTLVTQDAWQSLQSEKEVDSSSSSSAEESKTRTLVQDLGNIDVDGIDKPERIRLLIPEKCKGREFQEHDVNVFPVQQSSLVNVLSANLERLQESVASEIRAKLQYVEEQRYQLQGLAKILESSLSNSATQNVMKEFSERQNKLASDIQAIKHEGIVNIQQKVKGIEKDLLKLSSQFLTVQMNKKRANTLYNLHTESPATPRSEGLSARSTAILSTTLESSVEDAVVVDVETLLERMRIYNEQLHSKVKNLTSN